MPKTIPSGSRNLEIKPYAISNATGLALHPAFTGLQGLVNTGQGALVEVFVLHDGHGAGDISLLLGAISNHDNVFQRL